jgi:hypothetical protein
MEWVVMDMTDMQFEDNDFDVIIDKATMDALMVQEKDVWYPSENCIHQVEAFLGECSRTLTPNGSFLSLSFAQPHFRTKYLSDKLLHLESAPYKSFPGYCSRYKWEVSFVGISKTGTFENFLYIMRMRGNGSENTTATVDTDAGANADADADADAETNADTGAVSMVGTLRAEVASYALDSDDSDDSEDESGGLRTLFKL